MSTTSDQQQISHGKPVATRLEFIDALRGFACFWVLLCHVQSYWMNNLDLGTGFVHAIVSVCRLGTVGVDLFVVLSGFCLYWPIIRKDDGLDRFDGVTFFRRRARRIVPAYYAAIVLAVVLIEIPKFNGKIVPRPLQFGDVLTNALFIQNFFPNRVGAINGSFWSLALEAQLYVVFPLLVWFAGRRPWRAMLWLAIPLAAVWQCFQLVELDLDWNVPIYAFVHHIPVRWTQFVAGMIAAKLVARPRSGQVWMSGVLFVAFGVLALASTKYWVQRYSAIHYALWAGVFGPLLVILASVDSSWFTRWTRFGWLTRLGLMSYSLYLIHQPIMLAADVWVRPLGLGHLQTIAMFVFVVFPPLLLFAYVFFLLFERPFMTAARRPASNLAEPVVTGG